MINKLAEEIHKNNISKGFYEANKNIGEGSYRLRMHKADFVKTITLNEYLEIAEDVQLVDFIRLDYNPRISTNRRLLMKHINAIHKLEPTE